MAHEVRYCTHCAGGLREVTAQEDAGPRTRLRCPACGWTHWNNPVPVLAALIELPDRGGRLLLARNAAWAPGLFGLVTGFMEAGESPEDGIRREVAEETSLAVGSLALIGVYGHARMNQVILAWHAVAHGEVRLSPELAEYRLVEPARMRCWRSGTGPAVADWLASRGHEPRWIDDRPPAA